MYTFALQSLVITVISLSLLASCSPPPTGPVYASRGKALDSGVKGADNENPPEDDNNSGDDDGSGDNGDGDDGDNGDENGDGDDMGTVDPGPDDTGVVDPPVPIVVVPPVDKPVDKPIEKPVEPAPKPISSDGDGRFNDNWKTVERFDDSRNPRTESFTMRAVDSKIFPKGNGQAPNEQQQDTRKVSVYVPNGIDKSKEHPFMIAMDGDYWSGPLLKFVDKLIAEKKIPSLIFIIIENGGGDSKGRQRGLEYDVVADTNARFLAEEVIPLVEKNYGVKLTKNGEGGALFGGSSSGAAAFTAAWHMPQRFTKVLGYSSTFTQQGGTDQNPDGAEIYYKKLIAASPVKPIRASLQVAANDNKYFGDTTKGNILTYEALKAKGYHVRLHVSPNAVHTDGRVMKESMGDNLVWLWRDYPR